MVQGVLADVSIATGSVTIGLMLTGRFVFQYLGWGVAAAATPCIMALTGSAFFGMSLAAQYGTDLMFGPYTLAAAGVVAGGVTQVCCIMHIQHCASCVYNTVHHACTALCTMHAEHCQLSGLPPKHQPQKHSSDPSLPKPMQHCGMHG